MTTEKNDGIKGSGLDPDAGKSGELSIEDPPIKQDPAPAADAPGKNQDPPAKPSAEQEAIANKLAASEKAQKEAADQLLAMKTTLEEAQNKLKTKEREGLSEVDQYKAMLKDQNEKIAGLVEQNQIQAQRSSEQAWENHKQNILASSGLDPELWQYTFGNTQEELNTSITGLKSKIDGIKKDVLKDVPSSVITKQVGNQASNFQNEGIQPVDPAANTVSPQYNQKAVELVQNKARDVRDIKGLVHNDPALRDLLLGKDRR